MSYELVVNRDAVSRKHLSNAIAHDTSTQVVQSKETVSTAHGYRPRRRLVADPEMAQPCSAPMRHEIPGRMEFSRSRGDGK